MAKKKKKKVDKQIEEWNKQVRALGEKNRNKLMKAMRNKNA
jgi:hypothetical protein|tara:strand:+ start:1973 stop:2095 length:123 start_codon:yes stop_codon:yes gene_type:complete